jgi:hypothetical protein
VLYPAELRARKNFAGDKTYNASSFLEALPRPAHEKILMNGAARATPQRWQRLRAVL